MSRSPYTNSSTITIPSSITALWDHWWPYWIPLELFEIDEIVDITCGKDVPTEISDHEKGSFHEDSSNIDSTDEDVISVKKKKGWHI